MSRPESGRAAGSAPARRRRTCSPPSRRWPPWPAAESAGAPGAAGSGTNRFVSGQGASCAQGASVRARRASNWSRAARTTGKAADVPGSTISRTPGRVRPRRLDDRAAHRFVQLVEDVAEDDKVVARRSGGKGRAQRDRLPAGAGHRGVRRGAGESRPRVMKAGSRSQAVICVSDGHSAAAAHSAVPGPLPRSSSVAGRQSGARAAVAAMAPRSCA